MNKEQTAERIKVMQGYVDGKTIQVSRRSRDKWDSVHPGVPSWNWGDFEYRIKPEPREWDVWISAAGVISSIQGFAEWQRIRVREILE